ncbi:metal-dependent hydrolase [Arenicella xantha]|uniref:Inner membrane protein n=1 Tax=Arenicella xantha TaxID=644221 RepID=A0A395JGH5_9GAMM|nr:metal-dependent hydrolase [Arenicella xantha]RBP49090.1 inner membrane protein [Arenicella xantha]
MDPLTQGIVGVSASQLVTRRAEAGLAAALGFLSGMAADLDVLISSTTDPLLFLEYHRHFTHALVFIPVGALICAIGLRFLLSRFVRRAQLSWARTYLYCFAGYATHAVLDACTTYGTQLFWPFSDARVAWNTVSVIDPLFTVPLLIFMCVAVLRRSRVAAVIGATYAVAYLGAGLLQEQRATLVAASLAEQRGHQPTQLGVKPSFANLLVWKSVYLHDGQYYIDAVRVGFNVKVYPGVATAKVVLDQHFPWLLKDSQQARDVERFAWFSNDHLGIDPANSARIIDVRYSLIPNQVTGMWGIVLDPSAANNQHVTWTTNRPKGDEARVKGRELWQMIRGQD